MTDNGPGPVALCEQAGGDRERYIALMWEHGYLIEGPAEPLPCGWPGPVTDVREYGSDSADDVVEVSHVVDDTGEERHPSM